MPLDENAPFTEWEFTSSQWAGIVITGSTACAISFAANICVLIVHFSIMWCRPNIVSRLSLRMIVCSCVLNMIYDVSQSVSYHIKGTDVVCRRLSYLLSSTDVMSCMCLAMVGLSLVMIFVLKVSRTLKLELLYYFIVAATGVLMVVIPNQLGNKVLGPMNPNDPTKCWYYYHYGRKKHLFNWVYYYSWLLFSLAFAAICAILSIRFIIRRHENFSGAMDMFTRKATKKDLTTMAILRRYANDNTDVFRKIAKRCVCYPLVPLISKSWGVGIVIAGSLKAPIPYAVIVIDRLFANLLGLMVSCIYFTDPAIEAVFKSGLEGLKSRYVYDYFIVKVHPGDTFDNEHHMQLPQIVKVAPARSLSIREVPKHISSEGTILEDGHLLLNPLETPLSIQRNVSSARGSTSISERSRTANIPEMLLYMEEGRKVSQTNQFVIVWVKFLDGTDFTPINIRKNDLANTGTTTDAKEEYKSEDHSLFIPMHRSHKDTQQPEVVRIEDPTMGADRFIRPYHRFDSYSKNADHVETLIPYKKPYMARFMHWLLTTIFRIRPLSPHEEDENGNTREQDKPPYQRQFHDYTDASPKSSTTNLQEQRKGSLAISQPSTTATHPLQVESPHAAFPRFTPSPKSLEEGRGQQSEEFRFLPWQEEQQQPLAEQQRTKRVNTLNYISTAFRRKRSNSFNEGIPMATKARPKKLKRVISVTVADLQRVKERKRAFLDSPSIHSTVSSGSKRRMFVETPKKLPGLSKIFERGRSTAPSTSEYELRETVPHISAPVAIHESEDNNNNESFVERSVENNNAAPTSTTTATTTPTPISVPSSNITRAQLPIEDSGSSGVGKVLTSYPKALSPPPRFSAKGVALSTSVRSSVHIPCQNLLQNNLTPVHEAKDLGIAFNTSNESLDDSTSNHNAEATICTERLSDESKLDSAKRKSHRLSIVPAQVDENEGLLYGKTTLQFISNWEEKNDKDNTSCTSRIQYLTENWIF